MKTTRQPIGIYIHVPFCAQKCPYCDFYSRPPQKDDIAAYKQALAQAMSLYCGKGIAADTVYFGGGTPSLLGADVLGEILQSVRRCFAVTSNAEITCEVNPGIIEQNFFARLKSNGFNRISLGMQSAVESELQALGRLHSADDVKAAVESAQHAGFNNISLDLMLGVPHSTPAHLRHSIAFAAEMKVQHLSAYMLKIEEGTAFYRRKATLVIPDEDGMADFYQLCTEEAARLGFAQYEISNFAKPGFESRHNLKYWHCEEYLGFGPSAHSFYEGRRFYYPRSLEDFIQGIHPVADGAGGDFEEFAMLNLRLREGVTLAACQARFAGGENLFAAMQKQVPNCPAHLLTADDKHIALTPAGFAVSNAVILTLLS